MNNRFKFRFWDKKEKEYFTCWEIDYKSRIPKAYPYRTYNWCFEHKNIIAEQCTGTKDKNGKLVYEGDFIKTTNGTIGYIVWSQKDLAFMTKDLNPKEKEVYLVECEVIGNIHENADLLENEEWLGKN